MTIEYNTQIHEERELKKKVFSDKAIGFTGSLIGSVTAVGALIHPLAAIPSAAAWGVAYIAHRQLVKNQNRLDS